MKLWRSEEYFGDRDELQGAYLSNTNLSNVDLSNATLQGADLSNVDLEGAIGNSVDMFSMQVPTYSVVFTTLGVLQISCERHTTEEWENFADTKIERMGAAAALKWWRVWKPIVLAAAYAMIET